MSRFKFLRRLLVVVVLLAMMASIAQPALAGDPPNRLDDNRGLDSAVSISGDVCHIILGFFSVLGAIACPGMDGRVLEHPTIHNVFAADNWDSTVPPIFADAAINTITQNLLSSNYLSAAAQYGVGSPGLEGSSQNDGCSGAPSGTTNQVSIELWITCEVQSPGTGVPYPDDNSLYVIYLPPSVDINNGPLDGTCDQFNAYHLQSMALTVDFDLFVPVPHFQSYPYIVIPLKCANGTVDGLTKLLSHEFIEAATDPIGPHGWADNDSIFPDGDFLTQGEAADICSSVGPVPMPPVRLDNGVLVSPYWSNADNGCAPFTNTLTLKTTGLPNAGHATLTSLPIFNDTEPHDIDLGLTNSYQIVDGGHATWTFPSPVDGGTGVRYVTSSLGSNGSTTIDNDVTSTADYTKQDLLTVKTDPISAAALDGSLTATQWVNDGTTVPLNTDQYLPTGVDRYRFDEWSGGISSFSTSTSILMNGPKTVTAEYVLQHNITFDQTGIPGGVPWSVTVDGITHTGPYSEWFDEFSSVSFSYQDPVPDLTSGTRYKFVGSDPTTPDFVLQTETVVATYKTQRLLTVNTSGLPAPNLTTITNGTATLGMANDVTPVAVWLDDGTVLALAGSADVNGVDAIQYFPQSFAPPPPATLTAPVTTTLTYETMDQIIQDALDSGGIYGPRAKNLPGQLQSQFDLAQSGMKEKNYPKALSALSTFITRIDTATPAFIAPATAKTLELDAMLTYHAALCLASGHIPPSVAQKDYLYYVNEVEQLGGVVLPPCG
jgi:hypothetical protein